MTNSTLRKRFFVSLTHYCGQTVPLGWLRVWIADPSGQTGIQNNMQRILVAISFGMSVLAGSTLAAESPPVFELKEGARVVWLGDGLVEQAARYGLVEAMLTARWPDRNIQFRNLGRSADTSAGESRVGFGARGDKEFSAQARQGDAQVGFEKLLSQVTDEKPSHLFVAYGGSEAFAEEGLSFREQMVPLLDKLDKAGAEIILVSPVPHENPGPPLPDPAQRNMRLKRAAGDLEQLAEQRGYRYIDLYDALTQDVASGSGQPRTTNGMHLNEVGYR
ncbi:MAG: hypothetical protein N2C12_18035, partial [Planctomycetales bacterium]